jgi:ElaB/YqjD/DUF883 family membrane-anchored ribosome-binding protein
MPNSQMQQEFESLKGDFRDLRTDFSRLMKSLVESGKHEAEEMAGGMRDQLRCAGDAVRDRGVKTAEDLQAQIRQHPAIAVVACLGLGLLIGRLLTRD